MATTDARLPDATANATPLTGIGAPLVMLLLLIFLVSESFQPRFEYLLLL